MKKKEPLIKLKRNARDRLVPKDFLNIITRRLLPVLSLTYVSCVVAIAARKGNVLHYLFDDKSAYAMALLVVMWVSLPAVLWIILKGSHLYNHVADDWYKVIAAIMMIFLCISYLLFPEANVYGLRVYFAASVPMLIVLYFFFIKGGLPPLAAHPLTVLGLTFLFYGAAMGFLPAGDKFPLVKKIYYITNQKNLRNGH